MSQPPYRVSTFETGAGVGDIGQRQGDLHPAPRLMLYVPLRAVPSVMVSASEPPTSVSAPETVAEFTKPPKVSEIRACAQIEERLGGLRPDRDDICKPSRR